MGGLFHTDQELLPMRFGDTPRRRNHRITRGNGRQKDLGGLVMSRYNTIVIGGGINSLVTASFLGKSGKKVLLLEARNQVGGLASTSEFAPGFKCNVINDVVKWIDPRVMQQLGLDNHGLSLFQPDVVRVALENNGEHISFHRDQKQTAASIAIHSEKDAKAWEDFTAYIGKLTYFLEKLYELTPPNLPMLD